MTTRRLRLPRRLTVRQAALPGLLIAHATLWLVIMIMRPSLWAGLICLSGYLAALAVLAIVLSVHGAARTRPAVVQPECGHCGVSELTFAHAAGTGWAKVQGVLSCASCAAGFPAWMRRSF